MQRTTVRARTSLGWLTESEEVTIPRTVNLRPVFTPPSTRPAELSYDEADMARVSANERQKWAELDELKDRLIERVRRKGELRVHVWQVEGLPTGGGWGSGGSVAGIRAIVQVCH